MESAGSAGSLDWDRAPVFQGKQPQESMEKYQFPLNPSRNGWEFREAPNIPAASGNARSASGFSPSLSMEFLRLEKSSETNPPIPHPKRFAPNSYGKFLRNCTEPKENPPGKAIPEGKVGIKQELLVLDGLLFLIFSGNFGFRLSALLVLQKKTGIIRQIWASPEKRESKELPNPLGLGYSWEKGITGRGGMRMGTSDDHHEKTGNSHRRIPFFPNWDGKHGIPQGSAQRRISFQLQEKVGANQSSFSGIGKEAPLAAADPGKSSGIPASPCYPGRNRDGMVPMRSWE